MPNGPDGINPNAEYTITGPGYGDTPAALALRTREVIEAELKARRVNNGNSVFTREDGPFHQLANLLGIPGKGPFEAIAHRLAQALLNLSTDHAWPTLPDLLNSLGVIPKTLTEHTEAIANLDTIAAAMLTTPAYVGDMQDMVSVPRWGLSITGPQGYKCWECGVPITIVIGGQLSTNVLPVIYPRTYPLQTKGDIIYSPIVVDRHGIPDKLRWIVGADSSVFSIDFYETALCVYNPDNGHIEKVWSTGNVVDGIADTSDLQEVEVPMGLSQHVTPGQILFMAHQQVGPGIGQSSRAFAAVPAAHVGRPSDLLLDASCYRANHYSQGIPSSIALADLTRENGWIPWAGVSVRSV